MTEWLRSKLSERFHSIIKKPQTTACGRNNRISKIRGTIVGNPNIIQGLVSLEVKPDHVFMHLVESAPFNKGKAKVYSGVPGNLVAFACKLSFQRGNDGNVAFLSKTQLVDHYIETLGAKHFGGRLMVIEEIAATKLVQKYFNPKL